MVCDVPHHNQNSKHYTVFCCCSNLTLHVLTSLQSNMWLVILNITHSVCGCSCSLQSTCCHPSHSHHNTQYKMNFDEHNKIYNWLTRSRPPHKMSHGDINMLPYNAFDDKLSNVSLTDQGWKAVIKIQQFICFFPRKTERHHRDHKAVQLLVTEIIELNSQIKVLE